MTAASLEQLRGADKAGESTKAAESGGYAQQQRERARSRGLGAVCFYSGLYRIGVLRETLETPQTSKLQFCPETGHPCSSGVSHKNNSV